MMYNNAKKSILNKKRIIEEAKKDNIKKRIQYTGLFENITEILENVIKETKIICI